MPINPTAPKTPPARRARRTLAGVLVYAAMALCARADLPAGDSLVAGDPLTAFAMRGAHVSPDVAVFTVADSPGPGFGRAWRVETKRDLNAATPVDLSAATARAVAAGDIGFIHFYARAVETTDETGMGRTYLAVRDAGGRGSSFELGVSFGREWREFQFPFRFRRAFAPGEAVVKFGFSFARQTVEIGGLEVLDCGSARPLADYPVTRFSYPGREAAAPWRAEALARIERVRKSGFAVAVVGPDGRPVPGARVRVEERRSAFQFGTALQFERLVQDSPDNRRYRDIALELFNEASPENDMKWPVWIGEWGGGYSRADAIAALHWLREHHFYVRGHNLVWPSWSNLPKSIGALKGTPRQADIPKLVLDHIAEIGAETRGLVDEWDVLNEPFTNHDLMDIFGRGIMVDWFKAARSAAPGVPLYLNDFSNQDLTTDHDHVLDFEANARFLLGAGAPLGGLGLQAHIGAEPNDPVQVLRVLDRYAALKLPIRITEFDVWTNDEALQADYTRDFLILCFSHPSVVGVQMWGFWEKVHWRPVSAMYRTDWSEKPNLKAYKDLVFGQWRTNLEGTTGEDGRFSGRGFHGDYVATVDAPGLHAEKAFTLGPDMAESLVRVTLPATSP